jgi:hypothetical protein
VRDEPRFDSLLLLALNGDAGCRGLASSVAPTVRKTKQLLPLFNCLSVAIHANSPRKLKL